MMSKVSCIHVALLLVLFYPCKEMAVNFSDYFEFPQEFDMVWYL